MKAQIFLNYWEDFVSNVLEKEVKENYFDDVTDQMIETYKNQPQIQKDHLNVQFALFYDFLLSGNHAEVIE